MNDVTAEDQPQEGVFDIKQKIRNAVFEALTPTFTSDLFIENAVYLGALTAKRIVESERLTLDAMSRAVIGSTIYTFAGKYIVEWPAYQFFISKGMNENAAQLSALAFAISFVEFITVAAYGECNAGFPEVIINSMTVFLAMTIYREGDQVFQKKKDQGGGGGRFRPNEAEVQNPTTEDEMQNDESAQMEP